MIQRVLASKSLVAYVLACVTGLTLYFRWPFPEDDLMLHLIALRAPNIYAFFKYSYTLFLFTTPFIAYSVILSGVYIFAFRPTRKLKPRALPPYPEPGKRQELSLVLGEVHDPRKPVPAENPYWLTVPERGLYSGIAILGAIGTGNTRGCKVLEILKRHAREDDYVEVNLNAEYRYNPLYNDLDAFARAYNIASLLNNLFGKGKEPFWQLAYTNLVKFIIQLHKVAYDDAALRKHPELERFGFTPEEKSENNKAPQGKQLEEALRKLKVEYECQTETSAKTRDPLKLEILESVKRWFYNDWRRIENKLCTSIVEGIFVFLSLFNDNPLVKRTLCPPKECYDPKLNSTGQYERPLPPFKDLIEAGKVCALNFPISLNPGLAKAIGVMMKLDFLLNRIPIIERNPHQHFRQVFFIYAEYQHFAAVQTFRTKIFLALSDGFSAKVASELCGKEDQWKANYNISESGHDARVSVWTGEAIAHKANVIFGSLCSVPTWGMSFSGRIFPAMPFSPRCFSALAVSHF